MRILLCWELGAGSGHLEPIGAIGQRLVELGHDVTLATRDLGATARYPLTRSLTMVQAPVIWPLGRHQNAFSPADLLLKLGWGRTDELCAWIDGWRALIRRRRADLVITEHAPTALLAARVSGVPAAVQGSGFFVPPAASPLPPYAIGGGVDRHRLDAIESSAVASINRALSRYGTAAVQQLADLYAPSNSFLSTYASMDHFGERPGVVYYGTPAQRGVGEAPRWPRGQGEKIFAYMHPDYPQFPVMVKQLAALGRPALVVAPGIEASRSQWPDAPHLRLQDALVDLDTVAAECRVVICHSSHGMLARVLRGGVAPLIAPCFVEQTMLAHRLASAGLAFAAHPDPAHHDYATMIEAVLTGEAQHERARRFAADNPPESADTRFHAIVDDMLALTATAHTDPASTRIG